MSVSKAEAALGDRSCSSGPSASVPPALPPQPPATPQIQQAPATVTVLPPSPTPAAGAEVPASSPPLGQCDRWLGETGSQFGESPAVWEASLGPQAVEADRRAEPQEQAEEEEDRRVEPQDQAKDRRAEAAPAEPPQDEEAVGAGVRPKRKRNDEEAEVADVMQQSDDMKGANATETQRSAHSDVSTGVPSDSVDGMDSAMALEAILEESTETAQTDCGMGSPDLAMRAKRRLRGVPSAVSSVGLDALSDVEMTTPDAPSVALGGGGGRWATVSASRPQCVRCSSGPSWGPRGPLLFGIPKPLITIGKRTPTEPKLTLWGPRAPPPVGLSWGPLGAPRGPPASLMAYGTTCFGAFLGPSWGSPTQGTTREARLSLPPFGVTHACKMRCAAYGTTPRHSFEVNQRNSR